MAWHDKRIVAQHFSASAKLWRAGAAAVFALLALAGCGSQDVGEGPLAVSVIGTAGQAGDPIEGLPSPAAKLMLEATAQGLLAFDATGGIVPALAQRWIVEDEGRSYIFRLRPAHWPDGSPVKADEVAEILERRLKSYRQPDLSEDLSAVDQVVAMTGEVIEIRLKVPSPSFLQVLAQPQMGVLARRKGGTGPYRSRLNRGVWMLMPVPDPLQEGEEAEEERGKRPDRFVRPDGAAQAIVRFRAGLSMLVLGGRFDHVPLLNAAEVERAAIRRDPAQGLFGLAVTGRNAFLDQQPLREAISKAIDRDRVVELFGQTGWTATATLLPAQLDLARLPSDPVWARTPLPQRRAEALAAVERWRAGGADLPVLSIALPAGQGSRLLYAAIAADLEQIGVRVRRAGADERPDLSLIDEVAPYDSALWYLGRTGCGRHILCNEAAGALLAEAMASPDRETRAARLSQAETLATSFYGFIPLATPLRWSLVRPALSGFQLNSRARHPLNQLSAEPN